MVDGIGGALKISIGMRNAKFSSGMVGNGAYRAIVMIKFVIVVVEADKQ